MTVKYSLGHESEEQQRLLLQRDIYGDTLSVQCEQTDIICEFGCGVGANLWLADQAVHGQYIGIDNDRKQLASAKSYAEKLKLDNVSFLYTDGARTPLESNSVSVSFCRLVLIHQPNPRRILDEMFRVTRPGGRLIIIEPFVASYYLGPNKDNLLKCFRERVRWAYADGKGSPDVAVNLHFYLSSLELSNYTLLPHVIHMTGQDKVRCRQFLDNWLGLIRPVAQKLIDHNRIASEEWLFAQDEACYIEDPFFLTQTLWIAQAKK